MRPAEKFSRARGLYKSNGWRRSSALGISRQNMPKRKRNFATHAGKTFKTVAGTADVATVDNFRTTAADDRETSTRALNDIVPVLHAIAEMRSTTSPLRIYGLADFAYTDSSSNLLADLCSPLLFRESRQTILSAPPVFSLTPSFIMYCRPLLLPGFYQKTTSKFGKKKKRSRAYQIDRE